MEEAVGIICISEQNNGIEGDSPQAQREAIERRAVELDLMIVKRDGRKESYSREKIVKGLKSSLEKRPVTDDNFKKLLNLIERDLQILRKNEVTSAQVGQIAMKNLKRFDQVAYIRFASVYESFKDAHEFRQELNKLLKTRGAVSRTKPSKKIKKTHAK